MLRRIFMTLKPPFEIGQIVTNAEIISTFKVGNMGGMRRSLKTNSLILIMDHTKGFYKDKYKEKEIHYIGMGKYGDQKLDRQNKTLFESDKNNVNVYFFEVFHPTEYTYRGKVKLARFPYQEEQLDVEGNLRKVWVFPLKVVSD